MTQEEIIRWLAEHWDVSYNDVERLMGRLEGVKKEFDKEFDKESLMKTCNMMRNIMGDKDVIVKK